MRSIRCILLGATFFHLHAAIALQQPWLDRRDDSPASTASETLASSRSPSSAAPSASQSAEASATEASSTQQSTAASQTASNVGTTSLVVQISATQMANQSLPTSTPIPANALPIKPKLTPAMGLTGAILLLTGAVYTVIGIKNKWLYVFFSAAYLTSLAVSVLIVYLMSPPVSNAVQGAFFVAAFVSGLIFGGLSLVFPDITDGLGCLLGGFCLSMWFLTLKANGLITSTTGRAVFIGVMSFAGFSLSFSHYTRTYGLIVSISFAGATITVLGIDCFSGAGWKEFWLYVWNLNSNTFPLNTNTYPMTRGIKVEVACVVIIAGLGLVSQFKLWKVVKERREKNAAVRLERERNLQEEEAELGRRIEDDFSRERAQWENTYGDKSLHHESVVRSSDTSVQKSSVSIKEKGIMDGVEMVDMSPQKANRLTREGSKVSGRHGSARPTVTVTVMHDDDIQEIDAQGNPVSPSMSVRHSIGPASVAQSNRQSLEKAASSAGPKSLSTRSSLRTSIPPPPVVVPLPFTIPKEEDAQSDADNASVSAVPESVHSQGKTRPLSNRLSAGSLLNRLSGNRWSAHRFSTEHSDSDEALVVPHIEDDRASSIAATLDDDNDAFSLPGLTPPHSPTVQDYAGKRITVDFHKDAAQGFEALEKARTSQQDAGHLKPTFVADPPLGTKKAGPVGFNGDSSENSPTAVRPSLTISTDPSPQPTQSTRKSLDKGFSTNESSTNKRDSQSPITKSSKSGTHSQSSRPASQVDGLGGALPEKMSKVALSYRTNEWAKHLESAEKPELDNIPEPESPGVQIGHRVEETTPLTKEVRESQLVANPRTKRASTESFVQRNSKANRSSSDTSSKYANAEALHALSRSPSAFGRTSPAVPTTAFPTRAVRSSSSPYLPPGQSVSMSQEPMPVRISPVPKNTLMSQREALVRNKTSTQSFTPQSSTSNLVPSTDVDDLTLAQRKQLMQKQRPPSASQQWRQTGWAGAGGQPQIYDSHQPRRSSAGYDQDKREVMLANWRESIRHEAPVQTAAEAEETRRAAMINNRRQKEMHKQQQAIAAQYRDSMMNNMMRTGEMQDAHREAMRRMQAKANKNAG